MLLGIAMVMRVLANGDDMFRDAKNFNQPIGQWDTSNVIYMQYMFHNSKCFNKSIVEWNTSNVTDMEDMFIWADSFDLENAP